MARASVRGALFPDLSVLGRCGVPDRLSVQARRLRSRAHGDRRNRARFCRCDRDDCGAGQWCRERTGARCRAGGMMMSKLPIVVLACLTLSVAAALAQEVATPTVGVTDTYHGVTVHDPY